MKARSKIGQQKGRGQARKGTRQAHKHPVWAQGRGRHRKRAGMSNPVHGVNPGCVKKARTKGRYGAEHHQNKWWWQGYGAW